MSSCLEPEPAHKGHGGPTITKEDVNLSSEDGSQQHESTRKNKKHLQHEDANDQHIVPITGPAR